MMPIGLQIMKMKEIFRALNPGISIATIDFTGEMDPSLTFPENRVNLQGRFPHYTWFSPPELPPEAEEMVEERVEEKLKKRVRERTMELKQKLSIAEKKLEEKKDLDMMQQVSKLKTELDGIDKVGLSEVSERIHLLEREINQLERRVMLIETGGRMSRSYKWIKLTDSSGVNVGATMNEETAESLKRALIRKGYFADYNTSKPFQVWVAEDPSIVWAIGDIIRQNLSRAVSASGETVLMITDSSALLGSLPDRREFA